MKNMLDLSKPIYTRDGHIVCGLTEIISYGKKMLGGVVLEDPFIGHIAYVWQIDGHFSRNKFETSRIDLCNEKNE